MPKSYDYVSLYKGLSASTKNTDLKPLPVYTEPRARGFSLPSLSVEQIKSTMHHDGIVTALVPYMLSLSSQEEAARGRKASRDHGRAGGLMGLIAPTAADGSSEVVARADSGSTPRT